MPSKLSYFKRDILCIIPVLQMRWEPNPALTEVNGSFAIDFTETKFWPPEN